LDSYQELELVVDKMVEEFNRLRKENEQLWTQLETAQNSALKVSQGQFLH